VFDVTVILLKCIIIFTSTFLLFLNPNSSDAVFKNALCNTSFIAFS